MFKFIWYIWLWMQEVFFGIIRNFRRVSGTVVITFLALMLTSSMYVISSNMVNFADEMGNKLQVEMYVKLDVSEENHPDIQHRIEKIPEVSSVEYISKEEAKKIASELMGDTSEIIDDLPENPLNASFVVTLKKPEDIYEVGKMLENFPEQDEVKIGEHANDLLMASNTMKDWAMYITLAVGLVTVFMIRSAIKNSIADRSNEIETKKLIGASMFVIRMPFILEAITITLSSAALTYAAIYYGYQELVGMVGKYLPFLPMLESQQVIKEIDVYLLVFAVVVGILGSVTSVSKYVKKY